MPKPVVLRKRRSSFKLFPESQVQSALLEWLAIYKPEARRCVVKIDNEGKRSIAGHALSVRLGLHKGASDLFLAWPTAKYSGLWLEIKREKYKPTKSTMAHYQSQMEFISLMRDKGYYGDVGVGIDQCIAIVTNYLKGLT